MPRTATKKVTRKTTAKRATTKKVTAKKATTKRAPARKIVVKKASTTRGKKTVTKKVVVGFTPQKTTAIKDAFSKTQINTTIAEATGLTKKQVGHVFDELAILIERHIKNRGAGKFTIPGLAKIEVKRKPATKARKGINPFTGEETIFKAKPARNVVKVRPLKKLKDMV